MATLNASASCLGGRDKMSTLNQWDGSSLSISLMNQLDEDSLARMRGTWWMLLRQKGWVLAFPAFIFVVGVVESLIDFVLFSLTVNWLQMRNSCSKFWNFPASFLVVWFQLKKRCYRAKAPPASGPRGHIILKWEERLNICAEWQLHKLIQHSGEPSSRTSTSTLTGTHLTSCVFKSVHFGLYTVESGGIMR